MSLKKIDSGPQKEGAQFDRRLRQAIICFALVEFIVIALVVYHRFIG